MGNKAAVFIDAGFLVKVLEAFGKPKVDYYKLARWACGDCDLLRIYYYDCLPYQSPEPTQEERDRMSKAQGFFAALEKNPRFTIRKGHLKKRGYDEEGKPVCIQKGIDVYLVTDVLRISLKRQADQIVIIGGDSDFIPAIQYVQQEGIIVKLIHGPQNMFPLYRELWGVVDEREGLTKEVLEQVRLQIKKAAYTKAA